MKQIRTWIPHGHYETITIPAIAIFNFWHKQFSLCVNNINMVIEDSWNDNKILPEYDAKFKRIKTEDKVKFFEDTKVFD
jgi:hypothetical protein